MQLQDKYFDALLTQFLQVQTLDGEKIGQLIGGYIDIIMKKKRIADSTGLEGDEGATMLEVNLLFFVMYK